jgi:Trypsin-co-occurring domain 2
MDAKVTLAQAIAEIRAQLIEANAQSKNEAIRFIATEIEVELEIVFKLEAEAGAGFKLFSLVDVSGKAKRGDESTHKVTVKLSPIKSDGTPVEVADSDREPK